MTYKCHKLNIVRCLGEGIDEPESGEYVANAGRTFQPRTVGMVDE